MNELLVIGLGFFLIAVLYSTVGHAGASGYLAMMVLLAFPPDVMKPAALVLNIVVATAASYRFFAAGHFSGRLFWPFAVTSVPMAYLGGGLAIDSHVYRTLVGIALVFSALYIAIRKRAPGNEDADIHPPAVPVALMVGGVIGFVSGLTGVGGGIFLSPLLVMARWSGLRRTSAVAALFILVNSVSGLVGYLQKGGSVPENLPVWGLMVLAGGLLGSSLGATRINSPALRVLLGIMLFFAGIKMVAV